MENIKDKQLKYKRAPLKYIDKLENRLLQDLLRVIIIIYSFASMILPFGFLYEGNFIGAMISTLHLIILFYLVEFEKEV